MRNKVLANFHEAHQGALQTKQHACLTVIGQGWTMISIMLYSLVNTAEITSRQILKSLSYTEKDPLDHFRKTSALKPATTT